MLRPVLSRAPLGPVAECSGRRRRARAQLMAASGSAHALRLSCLGNAAVLRCAQTRAPAPKHKLHGGKATHHMQDCQERAPQAHRCATSAPGGGHMCAPRRSAGGRSARGARGGGSCGPRPRQGPHLTARHERGRPAQPRTRPDRPPPKPATVRAAPRRLRAAYPPIYGAIDRPRRGGHADMPGVATARL